MTNFIGQIYSSKLFSWDSENRIFCSDISLVPRCLRRLYLNDIISGFGIQSAKTGNTEYFSLCDICIQPEEDIIFWKFKIDTEDPELANIHVVVFNV